MNVYRVTFDEAGDQYHPHYFPTRGEAHEHAKVRFSPMIRSKVYIDYVEIHVDQKVICEILTGNDYNEKVLRCWRLTDRGGLHEDKQ